MTSGWFEYGMFVLSVGYLYARSPFDTTNEWLGKRDFEDWVILLQSFAWFASGAIRSAGLR